MIGGIYRIVVRRPAKPDLIYIGQASDFDRREKEHLRHLQGGRHDNQRLQVLFSKYGRTGFSFEKVVVCSAEMADTYEQAILDFYLKSMGRRILNICRECVSSARGTKRTAKQRAVLSAAKKGKPGRVWSEAEKAKVSAKNKGRKHSSEQIEAHRLVMTGRTASVETRKKMSDARRGRKASPETRNKMSIAATMREARKRVSI